MTLPRFLNEKLGVYCCGHVFRQERPVLLIVRDGGDWQFLCGAVDHADPAEPYHVCLGYVLGADPTLHAQADLPTACEAERGAVGEPWLRTCGTQ